MCRAGSRKPERLLQRADTHGVSPDAALPLLDLALDLVDLADGGRDELREFLSQHRSRGDITRSLGYRTGENRKEP